MKKCSKCLEIKQLHEFETRSDSKDGYRNYCRKCKCKRHNERLKERHLEDKNLYWKIRTNDLNKASGRKGVAKIVIKNSIPIPYQAIFKLYENQPYCNYCKIQLEKENFVLDHKTPLSRGGKHEINNITGCCKDCNQLKSTRNSEEFELFIINYLSRFPNTVLTN